MAGMCPNAMACCVLKRPVTLRDWSSVRLCSSVAVGADGGVELALAVVLGTDRLLLRCCVLCTFLRGPTKLPTTSSSESLRLILSIGAGLDPKVDVLALGDFLWAGGGRGLRASGRSSRNIMTSPLDEKAILETDCLSRTFGAKATSHWVKSPSPPAVQSMSWSFQRRPAGGASNRSISLKANVGRARSHMCTAFMPNLFWLPPS